MSECQFCNSNLVTSGLSPGQQIRCANCLTLFTFGQVEKVATHRLAWRSFWLGLLSICLLFITGLPAVYYGIRSLLRMRFVRPKPSDRAAAIVGTALGGCFGVFIGFIVCCLAIIGLIGYLTFSQSEDEAVIVQKCNETFEFQIPAGIKPVRATSLFNNQRAFQFADHKKASQRRVRIQLMHDGVSIQTNRDRFLTSLSRQKVNDQDMGKSQRTEMLKWEMDGEVVDVRKTIYRRPRRSNASDSPSDDSQSEDDESSPDLVETHQYIAYLFRPTGYYGLAVVFEPEGFDLSETDVQEIFANTRIANQVDRANSQDAKATID